MAILEKPIVIVGAGRSGSSLLHEFLNGHPQIQMLGEMYFTLPKLWSCTWETGPASTSRSLRMDRRLVRQTRNKVVDHKMLFQISQDLDRQERQDATQLLHNLLDHVFDVKEMTQQFWGFKEIWMSKGNGHTWDAYDNIFPQAYYLHILRHPFDFVRSVADWNRVEMTPKFIENQFRGWVDYLEMSRERGARYHYFLFTYEAFVARPRETLEPFLEMLGLPWDDKSLDAMGKHHVTSMKRSSLPGNAHELAKKVPKLEQYMAEFGYEVSSWGVPYHKKMQEASKKVDRVAHPLGERKWKLVGPFQKQGEAGWVVSFYREPELVDFASQADDLQDPERSPLMLFEDGAPLGPGHAFHARIRSDGKGAYSHWSMGNSLFFSTSDNSDPNSNGRTYTIEIPVPAVVARAA